MHLSSEAEGGASSDAAELLSAVEVDRVVEDLRVGADRWAQEPLSGRARLFGAVRTSIAQNAQGWVEAAAGIKGLDVRSPMVGEEWLSGPYAAMAGAGKMAHSMLLLSRGTGPLASAVFGTAPGGRLTVPVLPMNRRISMILHGFSAEAWMPPGLSADEVRASAGLGQLVEGVSGGVGLVLGAGNITSIGPLDALYEIAAHNRSVLLKLNPVLAGMGPVLGAALAPLIDFGILRIVNGGPEVGSRLVHHEGIGHVHITGSAATHDAIVWGTGADAARRKAEGAPLLAKPITSELGGVSPIIVVPGRWSRHDLKYQAEHVATQRLHNGGYNCIAGQIVIVSSEWAQKDQFLTYLRRALGSAPSRPAWYPGSDERVAAAERNYARSERLGRDGERLLITLDAEVDPDDLLTTESFAPVLGVVEVAGTGVSFLDAAVAFSDERLVGSLGANVIVHPRDKKRMGAAFTTSIAELRYGTVGINAWTGLGYMTSTAPWGAFPGGTLDHVGSGIGVVHNAMLIDGPERTVVEGPFWPFPRSFLHGELTMTRRPPWFVQARTSARSGRLMVDYLLKPSWSKAWSIVMSQLRG